MEIGVNYYGYDAYAAPEPDVPNARECMRMCQYHWRCHFWTFHLGDKLCYMKDADADAGRVADPHMYSGPKFCADMKYHGVSPYFPYFIRRLMKCFIVRSGCIDYRAEYDLKTVLSSLGNVSRWQECQKNCKGTAGCVAFDFNVGYDRCSEDSPAIDYLLQILTKNCSMLSSASGKKHTTAVTSGPTKCNDGGKYSTNDFPQHVHKSYKIYQNALSMTSISDLELPRSHGAE